MSLGSRLDILIHAEQVGRVVLILQLHDLLRQFAEEKLREANEWAATLEKHLDYYVTWAERADVGLRGGEQVKWFGCIEAEHDNLRVALDWHEQRGRRQHAPMPWSMPFHWLINCTPVSPQAMPKNCGKSSGSGTRWDCTRWWGWPMSV